MPQKHRQKLPNCGESAMLVQKQEPTRLIKDEKEALKGMRDARAGRIPMENPDPDYCIGYSHEVDRQERERG